MEEQLAAYRAKKAKEKDASKGSLTSAAYSFASGILTSRKGVKNENSPPSVQDEQTATTARTGGSVTISSEGEILTEEKPFFSTETILKVLLWFLLWGVFVELGFGAVYFIVSLSIILYRNTRTGPKRDGNLSAYSVFNPNCERLDGTFTAEQFEKELRHGPGAVH
ncbi:SAYSvFN domain-containing protein 1-like [Haliotis cracherodii]|uniref:SAYSvFN domain-containing protein 1-like n=1 Tax=Haliotis cracherodii TaxID=6455 RepID=UPI0039E904F2